MNSLRATAARFDQDAFWDPNLDPMPQEWSLDYAGNYPVVLFDIVCSFLCPLQLSTPIAWHISLAYLSLSHSLLLVPRYIRSHGSDNYQFGAPLPSQSSSRPPKEIKPDLANRATSVNQISHSVERLPSPKKEPLQSTKVPLPPDHPPQIQRKRQKRCSSEVRDVRIFPATLLYSLNGLKAHYSLIATKVEENRKL
jgi:hypothetical protein